MSSNMADIYNQALIEQAKAEQQKKSKKAVQDPPASVPSKPTPAPVRTVPEPAPSKPLPPEPAAPTSKQLTTPQQPSGPSHTPVLDSVMREKQNRAAAVPATPRPQLRDYEKLIELQTPEIQPQRDWVQPQTTRKLQQAPSMNDVMKNYDAKRIDEEQRIVLDWYGAERDRARELLRERQSPQLPGNGPGTMSKRYIELEEMVDDNEPETVVMSPSQEVFDALWHGNSARPLAAAMPMSVLNPSIDAEFNESAYNAAAKGFPKVNEFAHAWFLHSFTDALDAYDLSDKSSDMAIEYAKRNGYPTEDGELVTWSNAPDALRHFAWNAMMVKELGADVAKTVGDTHEVQAMRTAQQSEEGTRLSDDVVNTRMTADTLMDLYNNAAGRHLAQNEKLDGYDYEELFEYAVSKGKVITDAETVRGRFGISDDYLNGDWTVNTIWDVPNGIITVWKDGLPDIKIYMGEW